MLFSQMYDVSRKIFNAYAFDNVMKFEFLKS